VSERGDPIAPEQIVRTEDNSGSDHIAAKADLAEAAPPDHEPESGANSVAESPGPGMSVSVEAPAPDARQLPQLPSCKPVADRPPPQVPPVVNVSDLDWAAIRTAVDPSAVRARIRTIVEQMETLLDRAGGPGLLFDSERANPEDRAVRVASLPDAPLWFIGDLHGDLLALEAALVLIGSHAAHNVTPAPSIVFLGDLFDDEGFGLEVLVRVFELVLEAPERVCLIAGNHDEALSYDGVRFASGVDPSDFADFLNANLTHEWIERCGKLAVRVFARAPRALFFPDGLLAAHGGFPLADLHGKLAETGDWNDTACLSDFVWTRAHPRARRKLPNRYSRGSQFGYEDFAAFCEVSTVLGRPVTHMVRGHDHVEDRYAIYPAYRANPLLTTVALARRLGRDRFGLYERAPSLARYVDGAVPQVYSLHIPGDIIRELYPEQPATDAGDAPPLETQS
jgi:hypothetical protein